MKLLKVFRKSLNLGVEILKWWLTENALKVVRPNKTKQIWDSTSVLLEARSVHVRLEIERKLFDYWLGQGGLWELDSSRPRARKRGCRFYKFYQIDVWNLFGFILESVAESWWNFVYPRDTGKSVFSFGTGKDIVKVNQKFRLFVPACVFVLSYCF